MSDVSEASAVTDTGAPRTVRTARTVRLFGGLKSDLRAVVGGLGFAFQQPFALKDRSVRSALRSMSLKLPSAEPRPCGRALDSSTVRGALQNASLGSESLFSVSCLNRASSCSAASPSRSSGLRVAGPGAGGLPHGLRSGCRVSRSLSVGRTSKFSPMAVKSTCLAKDAKQGLFECPDTRAFQSLGRGK